MIPQSAIEEVKARNDIVDVVSSYVSLPKRSGQNMFGLCPFHREKTPSFSVAPAKGIYYCFGCHKGGDVIGFIMEMEKFGYVEAIRYLAERVGYDLPEDNDPQQRERELHRKRLFELNTEAARFYYQTLQKAEGSACRRYLEDRGLTLAIQRQFGLGFAPDDWEGLERHLLKHQYTQDELDRSGLFKKNKYGGRYDLFRGRLIFPIIDSLGRIIAFGGRVLDDSMPKYINSPETEIYTKGRHLFALNLAKKTKADQLVIVEGYMDALALHQAGLDQTVAILGTALTPAQAQLLRKYKENMILALDNDSAGRAATLRSLEILRDKGAKASVLMIPDANDPDTFIRQNGPERFRALLKNSVSELDYRLHLAREAAKDEHDRLDPLAYQERAVEVLAFIDNTIVQELYLSRVAEEIGTTLDSVRLEMNRVKQKGKPSAARTYYPQPARDNRPSQRSRPEETDTQDSYGAPPPEGEDSFDPQYEEEPTFAMTSYSRDQLYLFVIMAQHPETFAEAEQRLDPLWFAEGPDRTFAEAVMTAGKEKELTLTWLLQYSAQYRQGETSLRDAFVNLSMSMPEARSIDLVVRSVRTLINQIEIRYLQMKRQQIAREMGAKGITAEQMMKLRKEYQECSDHLDKVRNQENAQLN